MLRLPLLELTLSIGTWDAGLEAEVDSGFHGGLAIPEHLEHEILAEPYPRMVRLADGSLALAPHWPGSVDLDGRRIDIEVVGLGKRFLVGREVLDRLHICFDFGQRLVIRFKDGGEIVREYSQPDV